MMADDEPVGGGQTTYVDAMLYEQRELYEQRLIEQRRRYEIRLLNQRDIFINQRNTLVEHWAQRLRENDERGADAINRTVNNYNTLLDEARRKLHNQRVFYEHIIRRYTNDVIPLPPPDDEVPLPPPQETRDENEDSRERINIAVTPTTVSQL